LIACGGSLLAAGRYWYHKLLVVNELVRQQKILYQSDSRRWGCPDSVDSDQGLAVVSVRAAMYCCS